MARVRHQRLELFDGLFRHQVAAPATDKQHGTLYAAGSVGDGVLVLRAVAGQLVHQARIPVPAPAAVAAFAQQLAQVVGGFARAALRLVGRDGVGRVLERVEAVRERRHERQDALQAGVLPARGDVHQHHGAEQARPARFGDQAEQPAHRGADQHRRFGLLAGHHDQIIGELVAGVGQPGGIAVRLAMTARIVGQPRIAVRGHRQAGAVPRATRLAEAVCVHQGRVPLQCARGRKAADRQ